jgi:enterobactin synthetase component D
MRSLFSTAEDGAPAETDVQLWPASSAPNPRVLPPAASQFSVTLSDGAEPGPLFEGVQLPQELRTAVPKRRLDFLLGRACAREAMRALGVTPEDVARNADGSPRWPSGITGSITHTSGFVSAAVARAFDVSALGIDTERILTERCARQVAGVVAWPSEVAHGRAAGLTRLEALTLVFSAKETIFKCLYPRAGRVFDFHHVRVIDIDARARTFRARLARALSVQLPVHTLLEGQFDVDEHGVHTGMALGAIAGQ